MREQLKLLENLQLVDVRMQEMKDTLSSLPVKLKSLIEDVSRVEALLVGERQQLAEAQRYRRELETTIKASQDMMNKSKGKLSQVRTSKEYMATQRELETSRRHTQEREDELLKLMEAIEQSEKTIAVHEEELNALKEHVAEEEKETEEKMAGLQREVGTRQKERNRMAAEIQKDLLSQYDFIRHHRGNAVVPVRHGVCTGCNMQLPPQLYIILQREESIEHCPSCQRIVYFDGEHPGL